MTDTHRIEVGPASELQPGDRTIVQTDRGEIGVFNFDGEYYAISNHCAHEGGPVCEGQFRGALVGEYTSPGDRVNESYSDEVPAVACPWHGWEYDIRTGAHLGDPDYAIPTFDVVNDDGILVLVL